MTSAASSFCASATLIPLYAATSGGRSSAILPSCGVISASTSQASTPTFSFESFLRASFASSASFGSSKISRFFNIGIIGLISSFPTILSIIGIVPIVSIVWLLLKFDYYLLTAFPVPSAA